jgi:hypothetical protein
VLASDDLRGAQFYSVPDVTSLTPDERERVGLGYVDVAELRKIDLRWRAVRCVGAYFPDRMVAMAFTTTQLTSTIIFQAASKDVLMVIEDEAVAEAVAAGTVTANAMQGVDGLMMDTSLFVAGIAGTAPGVVEDVDESVARAMLSRAGHLHTSSVSPLCGL